MEHVAEFERLTRRLDAYHELLEFGHAERRVDDPEAWRREIRRQARLDRVRVRTFADGCYVGALKVGEVTDERMRVALRLADANCEAMSRAQLLGHDFRGWIRVHGSEAATRCARCGARLYVRIDPPVIDGEVFEVECR